MDTFFIVISCVFVVLLIAALVLWFIDSRMAYKRKKVVAQKIESGRGLRDESEDLYLKVSNGTVEICDELPAPAEAAPAAAAAEEEEAPPVVPMADELAADEASAASIAEKEEQLEELVSRYGEITDNSVVFESNKGQKLTFKDKYAALDPESRAYYDDVVSYILSHPDCRKSEASGAVTFKCKTDKIMRAVIKRGVVVLNFMLANTDLNRFVREEGIKKIKINPVIIRLDSDIDVVLAKQTADITIENLREDQDYRKQRRKEMRRQRYREREEQQNQ